MGKKVVKEQNNSQSIFQSMVEMSEGLWKEDPALPVEVVIYLIQEEVKGTGSKIKDIRKAAYVGRKKHLVSVTKTLLWDYDEKAVWAWLIESQKGDEELDMRDIPESYFEDVFTQAKNWYTREKEIFDGAVKSVQAYAKSNGEELFGKLNKSSKAKLVDKIITAEKITVSRFWVYRAVAQVRHNRWQAKQNKNDLFEKGIASGETYYKNHLDDDRPVGEIVNAKDFTPFGLTHKEATAALGKARRNVKVEVDGKEISLDRHFKDQAQKRFSKRANNGKANVSKTAMNAAFQKAFENIN